MGFGNPLIDPPGLVGSTPDHTRSAMFFMVFLCLASQLDLPAPPYDSISLMLAA